MWIVHIKELEKDTNNAAENNRVEHVLGRVKSSQAYLAI